jgi:hypothetical protein
VGPKRSDVGLPSKLRIKRGNIEKLLLEKQTGVREVLQRRWVEKISAVVPTGQSGTR